MQVMAFLVQPEVCSCNSILTQAVTAGSSGVLLKMRPKGFLKIILYFPKHFLPRLLHKLDVVLRQKGFYLLFQSDLLLVRISHYIIIGMAGSLGSQC